MSVLAAIDGLNTGGRLFEREKTGEPLTQTPSPATVAKRRIRRDPRAASDVLGSILLVGVTVVMVAGLGAVIASQPGPVETRSSNLTTSLAQGTGDWGTGDEQIRIQHRGGESLTREQTTLLYRIGATETRLSGAALTGVFADGRFSIGETLVLTASIAVGVPVYVDVLNSAASGSALVSTNLLTASCGDDTAAPTVQTWTQSPTDVTTATTGAITVTALATDACAGVNQATTPTLYYRLNDGSNPVYVNAGAMTLTTTSTWQGTIPSQTWSSHASKTLQYYIDPLGDTRSNTGASTTQSDVIQTSCVGETTPPTVQTWTQNPADVTAATTGTVTITAVVTDACAGVDTTANPELHYRVNDGSNPTFTNGGAMTRTTGTTWEKAIPDQTWTLQAGKTLEYELRLMKDLNANSGTSTRQSDLIQASCASDATPPTVQTWTQNPADVTSATTGTVTVTAVLTDACAGVDTSANPELHYRVNDGSNPAFTNGGAMTRTTGTTWEKAIPDQTWSTQGGKTLEYELRLMKDLNANSGTSTRQSDAIATSTLYTYVNSNTLTTGTISNFGNAQSASDSDAVATILEADTGGTPSTTTLAPSTHANSGATNPANVLAADDQYATLDVNGDYVEGGGFTAPGGAASVSSIVIGFEGKKDVGTAAAHQETVSIGGTGGTGASISTVTSASGNVYIAAIANGNSNIRTITGVSGLGLTWTLVQAQSSDTAAGRLEVWVGTGTPSGTTVTATFDATPDRWVIAVSRYSGVDTTSPIQNSQKAEANPAATSWAVAAATGSTNGLFYAAVNANTQGDITFTSPATERVDLTRNNRVRLGVADASAASGSNTASGSISASATDWQAIALTLQPTATNPQVKLSYSVGGVAGTTTLTQAITSTDTSYTVTVTGDRAWTIADLGQLAVRVEATSITTNALIDRVYVTVTTSTPTYATDVRMDFAGVPSGATQVLELRYRTTGDTFNVQVWDGAAYRTCTGALSSVGLATYSCSLTLPAEYQSGSPRVRFTDVTTAGATQGNLILEYVRVKTN